MAVLRVEHRENACVSCSLGPSPLRHGKPFAENEWNLNGSLPSCMLCTPRISRVWFSRQCTWRRTCEMARIMMKRVLKRRNSEISAHGVTAWVSANVRVFFGVCVCRRRSLEQLDNRKINDILMNKIIQRAFDASASTSVPVRLHVCAIAAYTQYSNAFYEHPNAREQSARSGVNWMRLVLWCVAVGTYKRLPVNRFPGSDLPGC